jgi:hypothetical protein
MRGLMHPLRLCVFLELLAGPPAHEHGDDVPDTPLAPVAPPARAHARRAAEFSGLNEKRIAAFLKQQKALAKVLARDPELAEQVSELAQRARDGDAGWEADARRAPVAGPVKKAVGGDPAEYLRTRALVAAAYDQYVATQELAELDRAPARAELARARVQAESRGTSADQKQHGRVLVEQAGAARRKLQDLLIPGFPKPALDAVARHEKDLQEAFAEVEESNVAPTGEP